MSDVFKSLGALVVVVALVVGVIYGGLYLYSDVGPRGQEIEQKIFNNTPSYINGKATQISRMKFEYETEKDANVKSALKERILSEASTVDRTKLPGNLQSFLTELERGIAIEMPKK